MHRALLVCCLLIVFFGPSARIDAAGPAMRPNVLFIYTDDQSTSTLGCYRDSNGRPWAETPNIDRLAEKGVRFEACYGAAWCTPSRASVMTGRMGHAIEGLHLTGILDGDYDPAVCRFWPSELRKSGYTTAMIGKWHLGHDAGHGREWDHSVVWDQKDIVGDWYNDQLLSIDGAAKAVVPGYSTDVYTRYAVDFVRREHDRPWLLWLCYNAPHLPSTVAPRHRSQFADAEVPVPADVFPPRPGKPAWQQKFVQWSPGDDGMPRRKSSKGQSSEKRLDDFVRDYQRQVSAVDEGIGQLMATLKQTDQLDNTIVVFTSDQGFAWGEHGFLWKVGPYDACIRMPLIVCWPGVAAEGGVSPHPVTITDLPATILAATGVDVPWTTHGHDLRPLVEHPTAAWPYPALMEHTHTQFGHETDVGLTEGNDTGGVPWWLFVRQGPYKYIRTLVPDEIEELYDLEADPDELHNLAGDADQQPRLVELRALLIAELRRTEAGMVENLPEMRKIEK